MPTPSEVLHRAADLIRDTAAAASQGQWAEPYWDDNPGDKGWWILNGQQGAREHAVAVTFALNPRGEQDARWIALMSPDLASSIEYWLRSVAEHCARPGGNHHPQACPMCVPALTLARSVLGVEEVSSDVR